MLGTLVNLIADVLDGYPPEHVVGIDHNAALGATIITDSTVPHHMLYGFNPSGGMVYKKLKDFSW